MKQIVITLAFLLIPMFEYAQVIKDLDKVGPSNEGYTAVMKDGKWGFMNAEGTLVIDFRDDLIVNKKTSKALDLGVATHRYPSFQDNRCIIKQMKNGVNYYGFINGKGETVIEPIYLNVSNFNNELALALKIDEEELGRNDILDKKIVSYQYDVVLLDKEGKVKKYLAGPFPVTISREKLRDAPKIVAKRISSNTISVKNPNGKWDIHTLK
ncbi:WG repeat-containing protein [Gillisia sp. M10.2A]|uniref:WG repeat-containing protein n=1 Tax=Gillisia lutea TaxID=2909668 RepID=A0ABS9EIV4_9FLAO|nr:WG repeat-containing protein [Gillisia lutea]MCF4102718.1 WG repeat-containing protein [Gillisia lutea]